MRKLRFLTFIIFVLPWYWLKFKWNAWRMSKTEKGYSTKYFDRARKSAKRMERLSLGKVKVYGEQNVPKDGGFIYVCNHQSNADPLLLIANSPRGVTPISKEEVLKWPIIGNGCKMATTLFIKRGDPSSTSKAFLTGIKRVRKDGWGFAIFPEGTRSKDGVMKEFKIESIKIIYASKAPIVPIKFKKTRRMFNKRDRLGRNEEVSMHFLKPISFEEYKNMKPEDLRDLLFETIRCV